MNVVMLIGRLTRDPELRFTQSGKAVANFGLAVDRDFSKEKVTDFFNITAWNKQAEHVSNYLTKGRLVAIKGSLQANNYEDKQGNKRTKTEVVANQVQFLDFAKESEPDKEDGPPDFSKYSSVEDEDVPF